MCEPIMTDMKSFNYLISEIDAAYHEAALQLGLTDSAMLILYSLCEKGGECLLSDVIQASGASKQTINSALRKLEQDGIVYLEVAEGRKKKICLTDAGKEKADHTVARIIKIENEIFGSWSDKERKIYLELTKKYLTTFKEKIKEL